MLNKIVYFLETSYTLGGAQLVMLDVLSYLAENTEYETFYINHISEENAKQYKNTKIQLIDIDDCNFSEFEGAIFVTPLNYLNYLLAYIQTLNEAKICTYIFDSVAASRMLGQIERKNSVSIKKLLSSNECCFFLDKKCLLSTQSAGLDLLGERYVNLCVYNNLQELPDVEEKKAFVEDGCINVGWLGPVDGVNRRAIVNLADNILNTYLSNGKEEDQVKVNFHIIGLGSDIWKIDMRKYSPVIRFVYCGKLEDEECSQYIRDNVDIIFAKGKDAIFASQLKVPVVLPVLDGSQYNQNICTYFFDSQGYTLDFTEKEQWLLGGKAYSIAQVFNEIYIKMNKQELGLKCFEYAKENFSVRKAAKSLLEVIECTTLTVKECINCKEIKELLDSYNQYCESSLNRDFAQFMNLKNVKGEPEDRKGISKEKLSGKLVKQLKTSITRRSFNKIQNTYSKKQKEIHKIFQENGKIKVAFIVVFSSVFPTKSVFEKMIGDDVFDPYIIVAPNISRSYKYQIDTLNEAVEFFSQKYADRVISGYDRERDEYLDLASDYNVIFFANPYKHMVHPYHELEYFLDKNVLTLYANYGFAALSFWNEIIAKDFSNYIWKLCVETKSNYEYLCEHQIIKGKNGIVTGYLKMDKLAEQVEMPRKRKMILICPHHTVWGWKTLNISNFLKYADFFVELPKKYPDVDFVFRPHPLLFDNLKAYSVWTQQQIDEYLAKMLENKNIVYDTEGDYFERFTNSDAMIHDCGSFIGEYLYTGKPCCYMMKSEEETARNLLPLGQACMENYYHAFSENDICDFIENVVLKGVDPKKQQRLDFSENVLKVNYPYTAEKLINMIKDAIK